MSAPVKREGRDRDLSGASYLSAAALILGCLGARVYDEGWTMTGFALALAGGMVALAVITRVAMNPRVPLKQAVRKRRVDHHYDEPVR